MLEDFGRDEGQLPTEDRRRGWLTGCLGAVALLTLGLVGFAVYLGSADPTPKALRLSEAQLVGTWGSADGGVLVLRSDGTFSASGVCGFGTVDPQVGSDSGTWKHGHGADWLGSPAPVTDTVTLFGTTGQNEMDVGDDGEAPVLWQYVGPPDDSSTFCKFHKQ